MSIIFSYEILDSLSDIPFSIDKNFVKEKLIKYLPDLSQKQIKNLNEKLMFISMDKNNKPGKLKDILLYAIENTSINFSYDSNTGREEFIAQPIGVYTYNNFWYFVGFIFSSKNYRIFRIDRILDIEVTQVDYSGKIKTLRQWITDNKRNLPTTDIRISVTKQGFRKITNYWILNGQKRLVNNRWEIDFSCYNSQIQFIVPTLLQLGSEVKILSPDNVIQLIKSEIDKMKNIYQ